MNYLLDVAGFMLENAVRIAPWFLLSIGLGVAVRTLRLADGLGRALQRRPIQAIIAAVAIGAFSPFCSCTVVPVVAGLLVAGVPLAPVMAFWVASPTMDPEIFTFTVAVLGWPIAITRLVATLILSLAAGVGVHLLVRSGRLGQPLRDSIASATTKSESSAVSVDSGDGATLTLTRTDTDSILSRVRSLDLRRLGADTARDTWLLGRWLLIAFALEAVILASVPQETIVGLLGGDNPFSIPLASALGVPLYVSNLTALPIIGGLLAGGMGSGAAIAFLLAGPVTTVPAMVAVRPLVRRSVFAYYLATALVGSVVLGVAAEVILS